MTLDAQLLLAVGEALLALLQRGDVGADADEAAVLGAALIDVQPAAILELGLIGADSSPSLQSTSMRLRMMGSAAEAITAS